MLVSYIPEDVSLDVAAAISVALRSPLIYFIRLMELLIKTSTAPCHDSGVPAGNNKCM